jgi:hypothetical protein
MITVEAKDAHQDDYNIRAKIISKCCCPTLNSFL